MGIDPLAPAAILLSLALMGLLPPRHPVLVALLVFAGIVGAASAEQTWTAVAWGLIAVVSLGLWVVGLRRGRAARTTGQDAK
jgi:hypothetical protein